MMDRRTLVQSAGAVALLSGMPSRAKAKDDSTRPNVVFIMADDLGYADLSCTGSRHIRTPAIDSIARRGVQLSDGYSSTPICSPTRTALLSGCYAQRFAVGIEEPIANKAPPDIGLPFDRPTIGSAFRSLGYRTKLVGKWHLGRIPDRGPLRYGYDEFFGIVEGAADYFRHHMVIEGRELGTGLAQQDDATRRQGYLTDLLGDEAAQSIEGAGSQPIFLSLHFTAPHWPWEGVEDEVAARALRDSRHYDGGSLGKYREMVEAMDRNVAKVLAAIKRSGRQRNTIVVFTSDNGGERFSETWPFVGQKGEVLEGGIRVPILIKWPARISPGRQSSQLMTSMDFLPTLLAMAGGVPERVGSFDGVNLSAQITGNAEPLERTLFWRFKAGGQAAVRHGEWKYVRLGGKEHLFNLAQDARERAERYAADPDRMAAMRKLWEEWNAQMLPYRPDGYSEDLKAAYPDRY